MANRPSLIDYFSRNSAITRLFLAALALSATGFSQVVISQIYGGGQGTGASTPYANDYVELFNAGSADVSLTGYAIQYQASGTTGNWSGKVSLTGTIGAKKYFLVQMSGTGTVGAALPTPDFAATSVSMSATGAKIALTSTTTTLVTAAGPPVACPSGGAVVDLVGYGAANCGEGGTTTPAPAATTAVFRAGGGCTDTNSNSADFTVAAPTPRNSSSPAGQCGALGGAGAGSPNPVAAGSATLITVTVNPATSPASSGITVSAVLTPIGGSASQTLFDDGTNGDLTPGDNIFSYSTTIAANTLAGAKSIAFSIADAQARTASGSFNLTVTTPVPVVSISQIQGSGPTSPYVAQTVQTTGIVTLRKSNGFYMQTPDAQVDGDPNTSEGIFVFTSSAPPASAAIGASVQVQGTVSEFRSSSQGSEDPNSTTELTSPSVVQLSTGNPLPTPIVLTGSSINPALGFGQLEKYEGMRVTFASLTATGPTDGNVDEVNATSTSNGRFYAVPTGVAKPFREPGIQIGIPLPVPGAPRWDGNLEMYEIDFNMPGDTALDVTSNAVITNVIGVLDYFSPYYVVNHDPSNTVSVTNQMTAVPVSGAGPNELAIAAFNIERFYDTADDPGTSDVVLTPTAFSNRLKKLSLAVRNVLKFPDIISFEEAENLTTLQAIAAQINADAQAAAQPVPNYSAYLYEGNDIGGIDAGFLVKQGVTVNSVTQLGLNDTYIDPSTGQPAIIFDRPPLLLDATVGPANSPVNLKVISVHLRSLNGSDTQDASGNRVRVKRAAGAEKLASYMQTYQSVAGANVMVLGDFNAFEFNDGYVDVMGTVKGTPTPAANVEISSPDLLTPDFIDLIETRLTAGVNRYSYNFTGSAQVLDHILVNSNLNTLVNRLEVARNDADFPEVYRNDATRSERISDHDMPVAYITLPTAAPVLSVTKNHTPASFTQGGTGAFSLTVSNTGSPTSGTVTLADTLPATYTATSWLNPPLGWTCTTSPVQCTTANALQSGSPVTLTLNVSVSSTAAVGVNIAANQNSVSVSGGGAASAASTTDTPTILASTTTTVSALSDIPFSTTTSSLPVSATVAAPNYPGNTTPASGTVTFTVRNSSSQIVAQVSGIALANGVASTSIGTLVNAPTGPYTVTADYSGAGLYNASTSAPQSFNIVSAPVVTTQPSNVSVAPGQTATFIAAATGYPIPTVQWQVSTDGVNFTNIPAATSLTYSFIAQAADSGKKFRALFTNIINQSPVSTPTNAATLTVGTTAFLGLDATAQGTWSNKYGADGYAIANGAIRLPAYANVTIGTGFNFPPAATAQAFNWSPQTTDVRALQNGFNATNRIASTYIAPDYSNTFQVKITANDNVPHQVALYLLDWDTTIRTETIKLSDSNNAVLDTQAVSGFSNGKYAVWTFQGNLTITITGNTGSPVLSGIFFDPAGGGNTPQPSFTLNAAPASATAGSSGSSTVSVVPANGFNAAVTLATVTWPAGITGTFGTNPTTGTSSVTINVAANVAAGPYSLGVNGTSGALSSTVSIPLTVSALSTPPLALSASAVVIPAGSSGATILTETPAPANNQFDLTLDTTGWPAGITPGTRTNFSLAINVAANVTPGFYSLPLGGSNGLLSASTSIALTVTGPTSTTAAASYTGLDTSTQGTWTGTFGADGFVIANGASSLPSYATVVTAGIPAFTWAQQTSDIRALQSNRGAATGIASSFYGNTFNIGVNLTDGNTHQVSLYLLDWDTTSRTETIAVLDAATNSVLDQQTFTGFHNGQYASWNVKGNVIFKVTAAGGGNAVVSGLFFAPATGAPPPPQPSFSLTATAANATLGSTGTSTVLVVPSNGFNSPVTLAASNWPAGITGTFVPNPAANTSTVTITVGTAVTPGPYLLTVNGASGSLSASTTIALTVTTGSSSSSSASFAGIDTATSGAWIGKYGAKGYLIPNGPTSAPTPVVASVNGALTYTWSGLTTDPRALQNAPGSASGLASAYTQYPNNSFNISINTSDFTTHSVSLYLLDWDTTSRSQTVTVYDAVTNKVLDTETFANFHNGQYVSWNIQGSVIIKVTPNGSTTPVVSGVFFN